MDRKRLTVALHCLLLKYLRLQLMFTVKTRYLPHVKAENFRKVIWYIVCDMLYAALTLIRFYRYVRHGGVQYLSEPKLDILSLFVGTIKRLNV